MFSEKRRGTKHTVLDNADLDASQRPRFCVDKTGFVHLVHLCLVAAWNEICDQNAASKTMTSRCSSDVTGPAIFYPGRYVLPIYLTTQEI